MAPTTIGALLDDVLGVLELETEDELLHPAKASAAKVSAGSAAVHMRRDRVIVASLLGRISLGQISLAGQAYLIMTSLSEMEH
jgi:hypothetical protein